MLNEDNSRPLDVHRWSDHPDVNSFVYELWDDEFAHEFRTNPNAKRKPKTKPKYQFKVLVLDLYVAWQQDPSLMLGVAMSPNKYKECPRYNALHISKIMIKLVNALHKRDYIDKQRGYEWSKKVTRIWPTSKLIELFQNAKFSEYDVDVTDKKEVIILNALDFGELNDNKKKSKPIPYEDTDNTQIPQMRVDVRRYNTLLHDTFLDIEWLDSPVIKNEYWDSKTSKYRYRRIHIRQNNKLVRRVFYRGSWEFGGRFHGGWWQQINSKDRQNIMINDQHTIEIDYSGLHVSLIYCREGLVPPCDPYALPLTLEDLDQKEQRKVVKGLVFCALNAEPNQDVYQAFRNDQPTGSVEKSLGNKELTTLLDNFIELNPVVEKYIGVGEGLKLMKLDGDITAIVINHFTDQQVPILSIHDSYIVPHGKQGELRQVMQSAINQVLGNYPVGVKQELYRPTIPETYVTDTSGNRVAKLRNISTRPMPLPPNGYIQRRDRFYEWLKTRQSPV